MPQSFSTPVGRVIAASANALVSHLENQTPIALLEQTAKLKALDDLMRNNKISERLTQLRGFPAAQSIGLLS